MRDIPFRYLTALQFSKLLPGVDRAAFRAMFENPFGLFLAKELSVRFLDRKRIKGQTITMLDVGGIQERRRVDARGARTIHRLYTANALPMMKGKSPGPIPAVESYAVDAAEAEQRAKAEADEAIALRRRYLSHPSIVPESAFGIGLLNDIFFRHLGKGGGTMDIGRIKVTKTTPHRHVSNSGKSYDWSYHFLWTSPDGTSHRLSHESDHAGNRRSDPDRNWGLGRA